MSKKNFFDFVRIWKGRDLRGVSEWLPDFDSQIMSYYLNRYLNRSIIKSLRLGFPIVYQSECSQKLNNFFIPESLYGCQKIIFNGTHLAPITRDFKSCDFMFFELVCTANWRPVKRLPLIVKTFEIILKHIPNVRLNVVGNIDIVSMEFLAKNVSKTVFNNIKFWGNISNSELNHFYQTMHVGVFCGFYDPCPNAGVEMIAAGLPVVVNSGNGIAEIIFDHGEFIVNENISLRFSPYHSFDELDWELCGQFSEKIIEVLEDLEVASGKICAIRNRVNIDVIEEQYFEFWRESYA